MSPSACWSTTWAKSSCTGSSARCTRSASSTCAARRARREAVQRARAHPPALLPGIARRDAGGISPHGPARARAERIGGVLLGRRARRDEEPLRRAAPAAAAHVALLRALLRRRRVVVPQGLPRARRGARRRERDQPRCGAQEDRLL